MFVQHIIIIIIIKFKQLEQLKDLLKLRKINNIFDSIVSMLIEYFNEQFLYRYEDFTYNFRRNILLSEYEITRFQNFLYNKKNFFDELSKHIEIDKDDNKNIFKEMEKRICATFQSINENLRREKFIDEYQNIAISIENIYNVTQIWHHLNIDNRRESNISLIFEKMKMEISLEVEKNVKLTETILKSNDFEEISKQLSFHKVLAEKFQKHFIEIYFAMMNLLTL